MGAGIGIISVFFFDIAWQIVLGNLLWVITVFPERSFILTNGYKQGLKMKSTQRIDLSKTLCLWDVNFNSISHTHSMITNTGNQKSLQTFSIFRFISENCQRLLRKTQLDWSTAFGTVNMNVLQNRQQKKY